jgi:hypothetical protein
VLPPWAARPLDVELVLVEVVAVAEFDATGLEQAAKTRARAPTAAATPMLEGRLKELWRAFDICTFANPVFVLSAPGRDDLPVSSRARRFWLDGRSTANRNRARYVTNDLGKMPGSCNAYRSW